MLPARRVSRLCSGTGHPLLGTNDRMPRASYRKAWQFPSNHRKRMNVPIAQPSGVAVSRFKTLIAAVRLGADPEVRKLPQIVPIGARDVEGFTRLGAQDILAAHSRLY